MRDPRFDKTAGKFNPQLFKQSYGFVAELQSNELAQHKERLSKLTGLKNLGPGQLEEKMKLEKVVQRLSSKMEGDKKKDFKNKIKTDWKKKERELVKNGKTPFFLKKCK